MLKKKRNGCMSDFVEFLRDFNIYTVMIRLILAMILGGLVGLERERSRQAAGLRTHILVCLAATMSMLIGLYAVDSGFNTDPLRIGAQVISGIGFIGAGAILVRGGRHIKGITTASGLWCTAAIGLAVGIGFYESALICSVIVLIVMSLLKKLDKTLLLKKNDAFLYVEVSGTENVNSVIDYINDITIDMYITEISAPKSGADGNVGITIKIDSFNVDIYKVANAVRNNEHIAFALPAQNMSD